MELTIEFEERIVDALAELVQSGKGDNVKERLQQLASALAEASIDAYIQNMDKELEEGIEPSLGIAGSLKLSDMLNHPEFNTLH